MNENIQISCYANNFEDIIKEIRTLAICRRLIKALNRPLNTKEGPQDQYVALWYHFGNAVMGRAWSSHGKIAATFARYSVDCLLFERSWLEAFATS